MKKISLLVVDDAPENIEMLGGLLQSDYDIRVAMNGEKALQLAKAQPMPDLILLDVMMPGMDGFEVCRRLKQNPDTHDIPVIFVTAREARDDIQYGLELGAHYYLTKPIDQPMLLLVVKTALEEQAGFRALRDEVHQTGNTLKLLKDGQFRFRTLDEARSLAILASKISPDPDSCAIGLQELFINAIEHGNLKISYQEKSLLNTQGRWQEEVSSRLESAEYADKQVYFQIRRSDVDIQFHVRDEGEGFDWIPYMDFDPARAFDSHGRGIAMAKKIGFSSISYQGIGNEVVATVRIAS